MKKNMFKPKPTIKFMYLIIHFESGIWFILMVGVYTVYIMWCDVHFIRNVCRLCHTAIPTRCRQASRVDKPTVDRGWMIEARMFVSISTSLAALLSNLNRNRDYLTGSRIRSRFGEHLQTLEMEVRRNKAAFCIHVCMCVLQNVQNITEYAGNYACMYFKHNE